MITLIHAEDWIAIYKDGKLLDQDHSFGSSRILSLLEIPHQSFDCEPDPDKGVFPDKLEDVIQ